MARSAFWLMAGGSVLGVTAFAVAALCLGSGCSTLGYYTQAAGGHADLLQRSRPVNDWLADESTPAALRERLLLTQRMRDFAVNELELPDNASYRRYADLERAAVVWNVVAAPELSLTLKTWCFPLLGCVGYRGYFSREQADALAAKLKADGWELSVYGVPAYSTLGWTNWMGGDPLLNTFVHWSEGELARLLFHELAHQVVYVDDDTTFNESFATAVERIGGRRWLEQHASPQARAEYAALDARRQDFRSLTLKTRGELEAVYASEQPDAVKRERKAAVLADMQREYASIKSTRWGGYTGYDGWFARVNNAAFGLQAAYFEFVPAFERLFEGSGGDFERFYAHVRELAALPKEERHAKLLSSP